MRIKKINKESSENSWNNIKNMLNETLWHCPACNKQLGRHEENCALEIEIK